MLRRIAPASAAALLLLTGLTACSAPQTSAADCETELQPGALSDGVSVLGEFGEAPQVSIPDDIDIVTSQRTFASETDAAMEDRAVEGTLVGVSMAFYDAATGEQLYAAGGFQGGSSEYLLVSEDQPSALSEAVRCAAPGERVVLALAPVDAAPLAMQLGGTQNAAVVGVMDVDSVTALRAQGSVRGLPAGFPAVVTNDEGRVGIVLPPSDAPAGTTTGVRIKGAGEAVAADENVIAQVLEVGWDGREISNSWTSGPMVLGNEDQIAQSGFTYRTELTGETVGSQVVVIENVEDAEPRVLVIDILGVA